MRVALITSVAFGWLSASASAQTPETSYQLYSGDQALQALEDGPKTSTTTTSSFDNSQEIITAPSYAAGEAFAVKGVLEVKREHKTPSHRR